MQSIRNSPTSNESVKPLAEALEISLVAFGVSGMFLAVAYIVPFYVLAGVAIAIKDLADRTRSDGSENEYPHADKFWSAPYNLSEKIPAVP